MFESMVLAAIRGIMLLLLLVAFLIALVGSIFVFVVILDWLLDIDLVANIKHKIAEFSLHKSKSVL